VAALGSGQEGIWVDHPHDIRIDLLPERFAGLVEPVEKPPRDLNVLLRNSASPRCFGHGFERNALPEALELAHEALGDVLLVFSP
jgi:hypothetical protein